MRDGSMHLLDSTQEGERWSRISALFTAALELSAEQRRAFVENSFEDPSLRAEVRDMLEAHERDTRLAVESPLQAFATLDEDNPDHLIGERIGAYVLDSLIGQGGMGTVYRAHRQDGEYCQHVAIKVIRRGMASRELLQRFKRERQILASLEHPNIARLYDGGVTSDGHPYLIMELVAGQPITSFCQARELGVDERVALMITVCDAVQHAHHRLVIHRDLKPDNIFVTESGEVKLLDFGIARLLADNPSATAPLTRTDVHVMTPEYASPEQLRGLSVTTASDVYALGVVFYELIAGSRPHDVRGLAVAERERLLLEGDVERPSVALLRSTDSAVVFEKGGTHGARARRMARQLRGDLDTITLRALAKSPERRYQSAAEFGADLARYRVKLPVLAQRDTLIYRTSRFVRRHRGGVIGSVLALLSLSIGLGVALWQADRAARERDVAREAATLLESVFMAADPFMPSTERADTLRVRDLLARSTASVRELNDSPRLQARLLTVLGRVHGTLGLYEQASLLLTQALQLRQNLTDQPPLDLAENEQLLGTVLRDRGQLDVAESHLRHAIERRRRILGERHPDVAESLNELAVLSRARGAFAVAELQHREALRLLRAKPQYAAREISVLRDLVITLDERGDVNGSVQAARSALELSRVAFGPQHPRTALALEALALALQRQGVYAEAEQLIAEALAIGEASLAPEHPRIAEFLGRLASIKFWRGDLAAAESLHRRALAIKRRVHGDSHLSTTDAMYDLAQVLRAAARYEEAERLNRESLRLVQTQQGANHPVVAAYLHNLAATLEESGDCVGAEPILREAIESMRRSLSSDHYRILLAERRLGSCLGHAGRFVEAESLLVRAHTGLRAVFGPEDSRVTETAVRLQRLYAREGVSKP